SAWDESRDRGGAAAAGRHPLAGLNGVHGRDDGLSPHEVVAALQERLPGDAVICLDVGDNTYWMSTLFQAGPRQRVLISGHWRCMGFGLPAAIAARVA